MKLYRIMCMNKEKTDAFAELITEPLRIINGDVYYTDARGRRWSCTYEYQHGRIVTDPVVVKECSAPLAIYRIIPGTGRPYKLESMEA